MNDIIMNDADEDQLFTTDWVPDKWIGNGKIYRNLLRFDLPPTAEPGMNDEDERFLTALPAANVRRYCPSSPCQPEVSSARTIHFAHLPAGFFLVLLPKDEAVKMFHNRLEIEARAYKILEDLMVKKEGLAKAVASLNTVRRKGKANIHILELPEDDCIEE
ncbi:hypothetical protein B0H16DRAFT_1448730 [Mycena metata]|uniref:Uncharacterized protein n=1 Tax=Mycena metata TaxID=1033252 RepID=A0AAD7K8B8_9AGAR|nr:hypothetical protein B0H16DRAFT_1448730 [Mycena metata]